MKKQIRILGKREFVEKNKKYINNDEYVDENDRTISLGRMPNVDRIYNFVYDDVDTTDFVDGDGDLILEAINIETSFYDDLEIFFDEENYLPKAFFEIIEEKKPINKLDVLKKTALGTGILLMPGGLLVAGGWLLYKKIRG